MKCPICKRGRVKRLRTYDRGDHIHRNNRCSSPKCSVSFNTIELTTERYEGILKEHREKAYTADTARETAEMDLVSLQEAIKRVFDAVYVKKAPPETPAQRRKRILNGKRRSAFL